MGYNLNKITKKGIAIGLAVGILLGTAGCSNKSSYTTESPTTTTITNDYIDTIKTNEFKVYDEDTDTVTIKLSNYNYMTFLNMLNNEDYSYAYSKYYGLNEALAMYKSVSTTKSTTSTLLDSAGKLDANKLIKKVQENNIAYMSQEKNSINSFYSEISSEDMTMICNKITEVVNEKFNDVEIAKVANTLMELTMFVRSGSASNAYVTNNLTFVYNPTMSGLYADIQEIQGTASSEKETLEQVITHETMHLLQYSASDNKDETGLESGICRMYNLPNSEQKIPVDSLWNSWLLEAAAELGMAKYLDIKPGTYAKKISYARSYNLSRFNQLDLESKKIEDVAFDHTLEEAYENLKLYTEEEKLEFLNFLYSVEIIQMDPEEFWGQYTATTGLTPTEDEKLSIRMEIRTEIVKFLTRNFYNNLADALHEGKVTDLDTAFYLIRNWELDVYGHLEYTKTSALDYAKDFIVWHNKIQNGIFSAIAESNGLTVEDIKSQYEEYNLQANVENIIYDNCNLDQYNGATSSYITSAKENYVTSNFSKNNAVYSFILQESAQAQTQTTTDYTK